MSYSELVSNSLKLSLVTEYNKLYIIPDMRFTQTGNISKFIFSGQYLELVGSNSRQFYPEIQVWRRLQNGTNSQSTEEKFVKVYAVGYEREPIFSGEINVYLYELKTPLEVEEGDVFGYYQPPSSDSLMGLVAVDNQLGPEAYYLLGSNPDTIELTSSAVGKLRRTPLINFEYGEHIY